MEKLNRYEKYNKKKKAKKVSRLIILLIAIGIFLAYGIYEYYSQSNENLNLQLQIQQLKNNNTYVESCKADSTDYISSFFKGFIENDKYSLFMSFLIFLGMIYLIMIAISAFVDITEILAFGFLVIRGMFRLPKKIINYYKSKKEKERTE